MTRDILTGEAIEAERHELLEGPRYHFDATRREFVGLLGAGLLVTLAPKRAAARQRGRGQARSRAQPNTNGVTNITKPIL